MEVLQTSALNHLATSPWGHGARRPDSLRPCPPLMLSNPWVESMGSTPFSVWLCRGPAAAARPPPWGPGRRCTYRPIAAQPAAGREGRGRATTRSPQSPAAAGTGGTAGRQCQRDGRPRRAVSAAAESAMLETRDESAASRRGISTAVCALPISSLQGSCRRICGLAPVL